MDFTRKTHFVIYGSTTKTSVKLCYLIAMARDSVRPDFLVASFIDLYGFPCDIGNPYLHVPSKDKIWFAYGIKRGQSSVGKVMNLVRALYGFRYAGASWQNMLKYYIKVSLVFVASRVDNYFYYQNNI